MSHWNYRVIRIEHEEGQSLGIHECYYDNNGKPEWYSEEAIAPEVFSDEDDLTLDDVKEELGHMLEALSKPILTEADFPKGTMPL